MNPEDFEAKRLREEAYVAKVVAARQAANNLANQQNRVANNLPAFAQPPNPNVGIHQAPFGAPVGVNIPQQVNPNQQAQQHVGPPVPRGLVAAPGFVNANANIPIPRFDPPAVQRRPAMRAQGNLQDTTSLVNYLNEKEIKIIKEEILAAGRNKVPKEYNFENIIRNRTVDVMNDLLKAVAVNPDIEPTIYVDRISQFISGTGLDINRVIRYAFTRGKEALDTLNSKTGPRNAYHPDVKVLKENPFAVEGMKQAYGRIIGRTTNNLSRGVDNQLVKEIVPPKPGQMPKIIPVDLVKRTSDLKFFMATDQDEPEPEKIIVPKTIVGDIIETPTQGQIESNIIQRGFHKPLEYDYHFDKKTGTTVKRIKKGQITKKTKEGKVAVKKIRFSKIPVRNKPAQLERAVVQDNQRNQISLQEAQDKARAQTATVVKFNSKPQTSFDPGHKYIHSGKAKSTNFTNSFKENVEGKPLTEVRYRMRKADARKKARKNIKVTSVIHEVEPPQGMPENDLWVNPKRKRKRK